MVRRPRVLGATEATTATRATCYGVDRPEAPERSPRSPATAPTRRCDDGRSCGRRLLRRARDRVVPGAGREVQLELQLQLPDRSLSAKELAPLNTSQSSSLLPHYTMSTVAQNTTELPPLDAPPQAKDLDIVMAEEGEEDEEQYAVESFANVSELRAHGIQAADIVKLTKAGLTTVGLVASASTRELAAIKARAASELAIRSNARTRATRARRRASPRTASPSSAARRSSRTRRRPPSPSARASSSRRSARPRPRRGSRVPETLAPRAQVHLAPPRVADHDGLGGLRRAHRRRH